MGSSFLQSMDADSAMQTVNTKSNQTSDAGEMNILFIYQQLGWKAMVVNCIVEAMLTMVTIWWLMCDG